MGGGSEGWLEELQGRGNPSSAQTRRHALPQRLPLSWRGRRERTSYYLDMGTGIQAAVKFFGDHDYGYLASNVTAIFVAHLTIDSKQDERRWRINLRWA